MPKFTIEHQSSYKPEETYEKIKEFLNKDDELRRFDSKLECQFNDKDMAAQMRGSQFKADLKIGKADTGSQVKVTVDLPLLLTPFKGKIQETLQKKLTKYLG